jgi:two-component system chemotaxis response regulator CheB
MDPIKVLIVDDSALMRNLIGKIIDQSRGLEIAGKAMNGAFALQKIPKLDPDIILLDLEMPQMNGIEFLKERKRLGMQIPVVILSSLAKRGAQITMEALSLGASDFIMKPSGAISEDIHTVGDTIVQMLKAYGGKYLKQKGRELPQISYPPVEEALKKTQAPSKAAPAINLTKVGFPEAKPGIIPKGPVEVVLIGISTGGPNALRTVFKEIPGDFPLPILVVQHMPPGFTYEFAKSLDRVCPLEVKEAEEGDRIEAGKIFIAPGDAHIEVRDMPLGKEIHLSKEDPRNGHRPSADVLFGSAAKVYGPRILAVIMTGMGKDGAKEMGGIYNLGGVTVAQSESSCVVYGMPKVAIEHGYVHHVSALSHMSETILSLSQQYERR